MSGRAVAYFRQTSSKLRCSTHDSSLQGEVPQSCEAVGTPNSVETGSRASADTLGAKNAFSFHCVY